jgi:hypothetical protein
MVQEGVDTRRLLLCQPFFSYQRINTFVVGVMDICSFFDKE